MRKRERTEIDPTSGANGMRARVEVGRTQGESTGRGEAGWRNEAAETSKKDNDRETTIDGDRSSSSNNRDNTSEKEDTDGIVTEQRGRTTACEAGPA